MPLGPGVYDDLCTKVRKAAKANTAIIIIGEGHKGSGFSVQSVDFYVNFKLPSLLRDIADEIEKSFQGIRIGNNE